MSKPSTHLIVQGRDIYPDALAELARLSGASGIERLADSACRLLDATAHPDVTAACRLAHLDFAFVPAGRRLSDMGLFVTDMDSTLITIECIDEVADMYGLKAEVHAVTEAAMRGELDFRESLLRRVALLEGLEESALERVYEERLQLSPGAEPLLAKLNGAGVTTVLVSGGFTFFTERLKTHLGFDHAWANTLEVRHRRLTGKVIGELEDAEAKRDHLLALKADLGLNRNQIIAAGDGANDLLMLAEALYSVAYQAKPVVREKAAYALDHSGMDGILNFFED